MVVASGDRMALGIKQAATQRNRNALPKTEGHLGAAIMNAHRWFPKTPPNLHRSRSVHPATVGLNEGHSAPVPLVRRP